VRAGLLAVAAAYLIGGIPFGFLFYRIRRGGDIRSVGSGNIGATNVARSAGWLAGVLTLLFDAAKGAAAVALARAICEGDAAWSAAAALAAVAGHCFPVALKLRGGKGVATGCGAFLLLDPAALGVALAVFVLTVAASRMVSAGSITAAMAFPIASGMMGAGAATTFFAGCAGLLIVSRHHENIARMLRGVERRIGRDPGTEGGRR
jgi:glycerol-3-phosphate acyltransferase PlsY